MFFFLPIGVDYRANRYPVVTFSLIGINVVIFLAALLTGGLPHGLEDFSDTWYGRLWFIPSQSHWYCLLTAAFVHGGFAHIIGNMIYLFLFGSPVEDMMGRWQFTIFYLLGAVVSNLMYVAFTTAHFASDMPLGGASGAISACMGAFMLVMFRSKIEFKWVVFIFVAIWSGNFLLPTWLVMSFWFLEDVVGAFLNVSSEHGGVAFGAHVGGFVFGMLLMSLIKIVWQQGWMRPANLDEGEAYEFVPMVPALTTSSRPAVRVPAPEKPTTYVSQNGIHSGPYTAQQIRQMVAAGQISHEAWYWREGMEEWKGVWEITG